MKKAAEGPEIVHQPIRRNTDPSQCHVLPCALFIIVGFGGLAVAGVGIAGQLGTISTLSQVHSLIMIGVGGGGGLISFVIGGMYIHIFRRNRKQYRARFYGYLQPPALKPPFLHERQVYRYQQPFGVRAGEGLLRGEKAFDETGWEKTFGVKIVGEIPPKPEVDWESPCPFSGDETVQLGDTHMLVLIPAAFCDSEGTVRKLSLQNMDKYTSRSDCRYSCEDLTLSINEPIEKSYWVLMARDVLPDSIGKDIPALQNLLNRKGQTKYDFPRMIETVVSIAAEFAESGTPLFPDHFTLCKEHAQNNGSISDERDRFGNPIGVMHDEKEGIWIRKCPNGPDNLSGVGAARRYIEEEID